MRDLGASIGGFCVNFRRAHFSNSLKKQNVVSVAKNSDLLEVSLHTPHQGSFSIKTSPDKALIEEKRGRYIVRDLNGQLLGKILSKKDADSFVKEL